MSQQIPTGTQAAMVRRVLNERFPRHALPSIADHFGVTLVVLQKVLGEAGYPDTHRMEANALRLEERAAQVIADRAAVEAAVSDDTAADDGSAATGPPEEPAQAGRLTVVRVADLKVDPHNLRKLPASTDSDIVELADSIAAVGLLQPIVARRGPDGDLVLVMGHRRYVAVAHRLHHDVIDCIVRGPMTRSEVLAAMLIENGQRKDLDPIAEARGLAQLKNILGCTENELARRVGRSAPWVAVRMDLLKLSPIDQARVEAGELGIGAASSAVRSALNIRRGQSGVDRNWHLGPRHPLAGLVRRRCEDAGHVTGRRLGGIGCGECWEDTIRADERDRAAAGTLAPTFSGARS